MHAVKNLVYGLPKTVLYTAPRAVARGAVAGWDAAGRGVDRVADSKAAQYLAAKASEASPPAPLPPTDGGKRPTTLWWRQYGPWVLAAAAAAALVAWTVLLAKALDVYKAFRVGQLLEVECDGAYYEGESGRRRGYEALRDALGTLNGMLALLVVVYVLLATALAFAIFWALKTDGEPYHRTLRKNMNWAWLAGAVLLGFLVNGLMYRLYFAFDTTLADRHAALPGPPEPQAHVLMAAAVVGYLFLLRRNLIQDAGDVVARGIWVVLGVAALLAVAALSATHAYNAAVRGYEAARDRLSDAYMALPAAQRREACDAVLNNAYNATGAPAAREECPHLAPRYLEHHRGRELPGMHGPAAERLRAALRELRGDTEGARYLKRWVGWTVAVFVALAAAVAWAIALRLRPYAATYALRAWVAGALLLAVACLTGVAWFASVRVF